MSRGTLWTAAAITTLCYYIDQGKSYSHTAAAMGRSKKSVAYQAHRLGYRRTPGSHVVERIVVPAPRDKSEVSAKRLEHAPAAVQWARKVARLMGKGFTKGEIAEAVMILRSHKGRK